MLVTSSLLLTIGGMILNVMVLPTLLDEDAKVPRLQSVPYALDLLMMTGTYANLGMLLPRVATGIGVVLWSGVAVYRV